MEKTTEKQLILPIKREWFDMIMSGEKREEYRIEKPYWLTRIQNICSLEEYYNIFTSRGIKNVTVFLRAGYGKNAPMAKIIADIKIKKGNPNWGAEKGVKYITFIIKEKQLVK